MKKIAIIVPCYNEQDVLDLMYTELIKYFNEDYIFNIILVDDGSKDSTLSIIKHLASIDDRVKYVSFSRNFGKEAAMFAGLEAAKKLNVNAAIICDADLQDPPYLIPEMLKYYEEGYGHVYAKHRNRKGANPLKSFFSLAFYRVYAYFTKDKMMAKGARDFCLLDRKVIDAFLSIKDFERFTKGIYNYVGFKKKCIEFDYIPRAAGETKWSFRKLFNYAWLGIREFSRVYMIIPQLLTVLSVLLLGFDITYGIIIKDMNWTAIRIDSFMVVLFFCLIYVMKVVYAVRDQVQERPFYITEDSNISDEEAN